MVIGATVIIGTDPAPESLKAGSGHFEPNHYFFETPPMSVQGMPNLAMSSSYAAANLVGAVLKPTHRYTTEISQMAFVCNGEGAREIDEDVCQYIEDIVRGQLSDIVSLLEKQQTRL